MRHDDPRHFGPFYNVDSIALTKWRSLAAQRELSLDEKRAYGYAVLEGVGELNRSKVTESANHKCPCASGSWESDGAAILKYVGKDNRRRANIFPKPDLKANAKKYAEAIRGKHLREEALRFAETWKWVRQNN